MIEVAYVILHYQNIEETRACVNSIQINHGSGRTIIVIVDNASPNGTGKLLYDEYTDSEEIVVLKNKDNLGFAKGLNAGIHYIRSNTEAKFIVLLNNDTELSNNGWDSIIAEKYKEYHFAALGPDIVSTDGIIHSNPSRKQDITIDGVEYLIKQKRIELFLYKTYLRPLSIKARDIVKKLIGFEHKYNYCEEDKLGVQLQGSCIILSELYFQRYLGLYDKTFLYFEEAILRYRCEKNDWLCMYTPELKLLHKGSVSVNGVMKNQRQKQIFYLKHSMSSCEIFLNDIKNGNE